MLKNLRDDPRLNTKAWPVDNLFTVEDIFKDVDMSEALRRSLSNPTVLSQPFQPVLKVTDQHYLVAQDDVYKDLVLDFRDNFLNEIGDPVLNEDMNVIAGDTAISPREICQIPGYGSNSMGIPPFDVKRQTTELLDDYFSKHPEIKLSEDEKKAVYGRRFTSSDEKVVEMVLEVLVNYQRPSSVVTPKGTSTGAAFGSNDTLLKLGSLATKRKEFKNYAKHIVGRNLTALSTDFGAHYLYKRVRRWQVSSVKKRESGLYEPKVRKVLNIFGEMVLASQALRNDHDKKYADRGLFGGRYRVATMVDNISSDFEKWFVMGLYTFLTNRFPKASKFGGKKTLYWLDQKFGARSRNTDGDSNDLLFMRHFILKYLERIRKIADPAIADAIALRMSAPYLYQADTEDPDAQGYLFFGNMFDAATFLGEYGMLSGTGDTSYLNNIYYITLDFLAAVRAGLLPATKEALIAFLEANLDWFTFYSGDNQRRVAKNAKGAHAMDLVSKNSIYQPISTSATINGWFVEFKNGKFRSKASPVSPFRSALLNEKGLFDYRVVDGVKEYERPELDIAFAYKNDIADFRTNPAFLAGVGVWNRTFRAKGFLSWDDSVARGRKRLASLAYIPQDWREWLVFLDKTKARYLFENEFHLLPPWMQAEIGLLWPTEFIMHFESNSGLVGAVDSDFTADLSYLEEVNDDE